MDKITKHKHHIIPKHAGGTDDPSNIIELTVPEHAEAHRKLWEEHGRKQDYVAWKGLSGDLSRQEILPMLNSYLNQKKASAGEHHFQDSDFIQSHNKTHLKNLRKEEYDAGVHAMFTPEVKQLRYDRQMEANHKKLEEGTHHFQSSEYQSSLQKKRLKNGTHNFYNKYKCNECDKVSTASGLAAHHKKEGHNGKTKV